MAGYVVEKFTTVIMDRSDIIKVLDIVGIIDILAGYRHGKSTCTEYASVPEMLFVETVTNSHDYQKIQKAIEDKYPGLCIFNPKI